MYQRKGKDPVVALPNFKMLIPSSEVARRIIKELLEELGLRPIQVPQKPITNSYLIHRDGVLGEGVEMQPFIKAPFPEMTLTELIDWKIVPIQATLAEVEKMLGHKLEIIEEEK